MGVTATHTQTRRHSLWKKMKKYLIGLGILFLSSCSSLQTTIAENEIEVSNKGINKK